ncbi:MAG: alpha/beta fold hydrolase [Oscillatoriales cyanobacterium RM2_1_1]|nr:alpha/beta fold hydrolase [Oscillatoriales cyanobacterium SM2_3_0]NJO45221.1 alpha/beta fold hydrolase [Oscillatoriales cyanobacterium RM2_1_1]
MTRPGWGAEEIVIYYGSAETAVEVADLSRFAQVGEATPVLALYGRLLQLENGEQVRELLTTPLDATPWSVEQIIDSPTGNLLFKRVGRVLKTETNENGDQALKQAVRQAANHPEGLTLLGLLEEFPGQSIRVDLKFSVDLLNDVLSIVVEDQQILTWIQQQKSQDESASDSPIPLPDLSGFGRFPWQELTWSFQNPRRDRPSPVYLYLPQTDYPVPLIIISHGLGSDPKTFAYLAQHLASHGYAVALPEHIETSANGFERFFDGFDNPPDPSAFANRPRDITDLINQLEQRSRTDPAFPGKIDFQNVGVVGQSFGGYTALAVAGAGLNLSTLTQGCRNFINRRISLNLSTLLQCQAIDIAREQTNFRDPRVKGAIAINPLASLVFGETGLGQIQIPVMIISGTNDYVTPAVTEQILPFTWLKTLEKYLVLVEPGTHFSLLDEPRGRTFPPELIGPDPTLAYPYLQAIALAFFDLHLLNRSAAAAYLTPTYLDQLDEPPFSLSILRQLTAAEIRQAIQSR